MSGNMQRMLPLMLLILPLSALAAETVQIEGQGQDLPPLARVEAALRGHLNVQLAENEQRAEQANLRKWEGGTYEFTLRAGSAQREMSANGQRLREWDVALERPLRLPNKVFMDSDIGAAGISRADYALGDARHEAARMLLHLWFNWQREQVQVDLWQRQVDLLQQQSQITEKRMRAGDAPRMELTQAQAVAAQAGVSLQQADLRARLAASELQRTFPDIQLPSQVALAIPQVVEQELDYWQQKVLDDNHELGMMEADSRVQQLLAQRQRADRIPDPTVGLRYSSEKDGEEKVAGIYLSVPLSFGLRGANAEVAQQHAASADARVQATRRRLQGDVYATFTQARNNYQIWQQAQQAMRGIQQNAELVSRAYTLGESSLNDVLNARRLALESGMAALLAQLDANEARYRLLLDAHMLWVQEGH